MAQPIYGDDGLPTGTQPDDQPDEQGRYPGEPGYGTGPVAAPPAADGFDPSRVPEGVPEAWARDFISRNPNDYGRLAEAYRSGRGTWFDQNAPGDGFGATPSPYGEVYTAGVYTPPQFQGQFTAPTAEGLTSDPGYRARMDATQRGFERSAAARGSILSGGFVGRTLPRALGEQASNEYGNSFKRAFETYQQQYGQFSDAAARDANAFGQNETGKLNQFATRYRSYQDVIAAKRTSEEDRWRREMDLARLGLDSTTAGAAR